MKSEAKTHFWQKIVAFTIKNNIGNAAYMANSASESDTVYIQSGNINCFENFFVHQMRKIFRQLQIKFFSLAC